MYFYLTMGAVVVFGIWLTWTNKRSRSMATPQGRAAQWKDIGRVLVVAIVLGAAIVTTSNYSDTRAKRGIAAYNQGRYAAAETDLRLAMNFAPRDIKPRYYLGLCLRREGKDQEARQVFEDVCSMVHGSRYQSPIKDQMAQDAEAQIQQIDRKP